MSVAPEAFPARLRTLPRQARSQARIDAVLAAAAVLLEREGADAVTTTRVAAEAGMAVGSVYRYFPDRSAILDALAASYLAEFGDLMEELVEQAEHQTWDDPVGLMLDVYAEFYRSQPALRAIWFGMHHTEEMLVRDREHSRVTARVLERVVLAQNIAYVGNLASACYACVLTADVLLKEAFRDDPEGDAGLLEQAKAILRAYLSASR